MPIRSKNKYTKVSYKQVQFDKDYRSSSRSIRLPLVEPEGIEGDGEGHFSSSS